MTITANTLRLLVLGLLLVNGWTDAPNAIATGVSCGSLTYRRGVLLAAVCNLCGTILACLLFPAVATTMEGLISFSNPQAARMALCGAMMSVILWSILAWRLGLPTSESHGLLAGLTGAALALPHQALLHPAPWGLVGLGLLVSLGGGVCSGRLCTQLLSNRPLNPALWQRVCAALTATLHGVQDGQKFFAILLLVDGLDGQPSPPIPLLLLTALMMALGTALGARPIIQTMGQELATLTPTRGLGADVGTILTLALCSLGGLPVSTTHVKGAAIAGAGEHPQGGVILNLLLVWVLTFPLCGGLAYLFTRLMTA